VSRGAGVFLLLVSFVNPFQPVIAYAAGNKNSGELIDIGDGRKMFLECRGSGSPTVILESGYREERCSINYCTATVMVCPGFPKSVR